MGSIASPDRATAARARTARGLSWTRFFHRVGGTIGALLLIWIAGTGVLVQCLDLKAIATHEPQTTPTQLSMQEGMYGPGGYAVIQRSDFTAATLPRGLDIHQVVATVLRAAHNSQGQGGGTGSESVAAAPSDPVAWVEVRMARGAPIGQVMLGSSLVAFDALTGAPVTPVPAVPLPQGRTLPPSLRQSLKILHRFWNRSDTPGVYVEFLAGFFLLLMIFSGLVLYFRLLGARVRQGRRSLLWFPGGGAWRQLHRAVSVVAAAFLLCIALSGTWIGFESSWGPMKRALSGAPARAGGPPQAGGGPKGGGPAGGRGQPNAVDNIRPLRDAEVQEMITTTLASMKEKHGDQALKVVRLRTYGTVKEGVYISTDGDVTHQFVFNADTGAPNSLSEPGYPVGNFPLGVQVHENMKHFHSGEMFGVSTRIVNLLSGGALTFLSLSGLVLYCNLWLARRRGGKNSLVWR